MISSIRFVILAISILAIQAALADRPAPPRDYVLDVEGGEYVFVMLATDDLHANENLRAKWSRSGLYAIDNPDDPLWTVEWHAHSVIPFSDGRRLLRWGPWAETTDDLAVAFYLSGEELNHYHIRELIDDESTLERSTSHFTWNTGWSLDLATGVLTIDMTDGQQHRFDTTRGQLIKND
jgi:hypothetical protein